MKRIFAVALALIIVLSLTPIANAAGPKRITVASASLSFSGTTAICSATISNLNKSISATMTLYHNGSAIASWSGSGTSVVNLDGSCSVTKGQTYTLVVSGTVDGDSFSSAPVTKTC